MALQIFSLILVFVLSGYVIFLHIQLAKKNLFIESTLRSISGIESKMSPEEMAAFIEKVRNFSNLSSLFTDRILEDNTVEFIIENEQDNKVFIHYTKDEADARNILAEGFKYAESFYRTAMPVTQDKLDLIVKHNSRKIYGDFLIIICISKNTVIHYSAEIEKAGIRNCSFENILTEVPPVKNENSEMLYVLPAHFIKGYVNYRTGVIVKNQVFDPGYDTSAFIKNIDRFR
jgi:hypothetical protein